MKTAQLSIPKALRKQAALRQLKTPAVLAQQAALNEVMLGRKGGAHTAPQQRQARLAQIQAKEALQAMKATSAA